MENLTVDVLYEVLFAGLKRGPKPQSLFGVLAAALQANVGPASHVSADPVSRIVRNFWDPTVSGTRKFCSLRLVIGAVVLVSRARESVLRRVCGYKGKVYACAVAKDAAVKGCAS